VQAFQAQWESGRVAKWRSLTWAEYKQFEHQLTYDCPASVHCDVYRAVLIEGPSLDEGPELYRAPAGLVEFVARSLLDNNPFNGQYQDVKRAVDMKRQERRQDYLQTCKAVIAGIFRYTFEEMDKWDAEKFFEMVAAAEFVSGRKLEPGDPEAPKGGKRQAQKRPLTEGQRQVIDRVQQRDSRMPMPTEERVSDPDVGDAQQQGPRKRPLNDAQQLVLNRVVKQRRQQQR
jgi:hypothetical protein